MWKQTNNKKEQENFDTSVFTNSCSLVVFKSLSLLIEKNLEVLQTSVKIE